MDDQSARQEEAAPISPQITIDAAQSPILLGTFGFAGAEVDAAEGGAFFGGIWGATHIGACRGDALQESWGGGEGPFAGVGKITSLSDTNYRIPFRGIPNAVIANTNAQRQSPQGVVRCGPVLAPRSSR